MTGFFSLSLTLFLIMDALGVIPTYLSLVKQLPRKRQLLIAVRELLIALLVMIIFHYFGQFLLTLLGVTTTTVQISGGIILFLIAIRLIFPTDDEEPKIEGGEPFVVPIAIPLIAGPSVLAAIMIYAQEQPSDFFVLGAIGVAWLASSVVILLARPIQYLIKDKGLMACKRLMGLLLALIAVQMFLQGIQGCLTVVK